MLTLTNKQLFSFYNELYRDKDYAKWHKNCSLILDNTEILTEDQFNQLTQCDAMVICSGYSSITIQEIIATAYYIKRGYEITTYDRNGNIMALAYRANELTISQV